MTSAIRTLAELDRGTAGKLAATVLARSAASIVTLEPQAPRRSGLDVQLTPSLHDVTARRRLDEPAAADHPAPALASTPRPAITRTLASGIRVVLVPSRAATAEVRMVFAAGHGDERPGEHGAALLAAHALEPAPYDLPDLVRFYTAGGRISREVGLDHTTFAARGLARDFDRLLTVVELLLHNGRYGSLATTLERIRALPARDRDAAIEAAWRVARYGRGHVYAARPALRSDYGRVSPAMIAAFRARHYRPDRLTVIIAGGFDPKLADAWIDHQFASWVTDAPPPERPTKRARVMPWALAVHEDTTMVQVRIALPVGGPRAVQLVTAALIHQAIADVRHQLGAAYHLAATLESARLSSAILISGHVDANRAADALALVRARLAALSEPGDETASRFVAARRRVMMDLRSAVASSHELADHAERGVITGTEPAVELEAVRRLTARAVVPALQRVTLERSAILLRGPRDVLERAFAVLEREPWTVR